MIPCAQNSETAEQPRRGRGIRRPDGYDPYFAFRAPRPLRAAAIEAATRRGITPSELGRDALAAYLAGLEDEAQSGRDAASVLPNVEACAAT